MINKILLVFLLQDILFLASGGLLIGVVFITKAAMASDPTMDNVAANMLLMQTPISGVIAAGVMTFVTFLLSLPGIVLSTNRMWLKITAFMIATTALLTLVIGVDIWFSTLQTRSNLGTTWAQQAKLSQSLLQQKFKCCGYLDNPFIQDRVCTSAFEAAQLGSCAGPFSNFANSFLDLVFTTIFGLAGADLALFLSVTVVLKDRAEKQRYRHIDEKNGFRGI